MTSVRLALALATLALTSGCASTHATNPADPFESVNRGVYKFNTTLDNAITKPVAKGYNAVMPAPGKLVVSNFFSNLDDVIVTANDLLQFKFVQAASDGTRFLVNSTFGLFGLFNVASRLPKHDEDFGQTLGYWGIASGPYVMLPILGPSTFRDGVGLYVDGRPSKLRRINHMRTRNQMYLLKGINRRGQLFDQEKVINEAALDPYAFLRDAYLLRRKSLVYDGNPPRAKYDFEDFEEESKPVDTKPAPQDSTSDDQTSSTTPTLASPQTSDDPAVPENIHKVWPTQAGNTH